VTLPTKNADNFEPFVCLDKRAKYKTFVEKVIKYLQAKLAVPAVNESFLGRMGTCSNLSAKTKVFGVVVDASPILVDIINQRPCT